MQTCLDNNCYVQKERPRYHIFIKDLEDLSEVETNKTVLKQISRAGDTFRYNIKEYPLIVGENIINWEVQFVL